LKSVVPLSRDRGFESISLQRGVGCEPDFRGGTEGPAGLISKRRGRSSNRRKPEAVRTKALSIIRDHYWDFGPTLAAEKLGEVPQIALGRETLLADFSSSAGVFLCHPRKLPVGRSRSTPGGNGLCSFCRNWDGRNCSRQNGLFWREHGYRPDLLPRAHPPRAHRPEDLFGHRQVRTKADSAVSRPDARLLDGLLK
jgi:hypothetical protein